MTITSASGQGRVGIGTVAPDDLLHVLSGTNGRVILQSTNRGNVSYDLVSNGATAKFGIENFTPTDGRIYLGHDASWPIEFRMYGAVPMRVHSNRVDVFGGLNVTDNVGIGTPIPNAKVHIAGLNTPNATALLVTGPPSGQGSTAKIVGDLLVEGFIVSSKNVSADKVFGAVYG